MLQQKSFFSVMYSCCCLTGLGLNILVLFPSLSKSTATNCHPATFCGQCGRAITVRLHHLSIRTQEQVRAPSNCRHGRRREKNYAQIEHDRSICSWSPRAAAALIDIYRRQFVNRFSIGVIYYVIRTSPKLGQKSEYTPKRSC